MVVSGANFRNSQNSIFRSALFDSPRPYPILIQNYKVNPLNTFSSTMLYNSKNEIRKTTRD